MAIHTLTYLMLLMGTPLLLLGLNACVIRLAASLKSPAAPQLLTILCLALGYPIMGVLSWQLYLRHLSDGMNQLWAGFYGLGVYGAVAYAYFHLYNMGETARRFRILSEIKARGRMTRDEIVALYQPSTMLLVRLDRLEALGQLRRMGDQYFLRAKLLYWIAKILRAWARVLGFEWERVL